MVHLEYQGGKLQIRGEFGYQGDVVIDSVTLLGQKGGRTRRDGEDEMKPVVSKKVNLVLKGPAVIEV